MFELPSSPSWPKEQPYKGLANYESEDELLFAGREVETRRCAHLLAQTDTRVFILHGQTGCGKSSFLRAGLVPALERNANAYVFLRRRREGSPGQSSPVFIRCGADPIARIAEAVFLFCSESVVVRMADGGTRKVDLAPALQGRDTIAKFIESCSEDTDVLLQALSAIRKGLAYTLVLILDQVEEVITQTDSADRADARRRFFAFLKDLVVSRLDIRFIVAIRKDHSGQFIGSIQVDHKISPAFKTFFLPELSKEGMTEAILRPTLAVPPDSRTTVSPRSVYCFEFEDGVVEKMVHDLDELLPSGSTLPVLQIVCRDLVRQLLPAHRGSRTIPMRLYEEGEIQGRVLRHLEACIESLIKDPEVGASTPDSKEKWMRVLRMFVQEEGDGRMHTDLVHSMRFTRWVVEEGLRVDIGKAIAKLTDPSNLILRQFTVHAPGANVERVLLCLGHDLIGNAIVDHLKVLEATNAALKKAEEEAVAVRLRTEQEARRLRDEAEAVAMKARIESDRKLEEARRTTRRVRNVAIGIGAVLIGAIGLGAYLINKARVSTIASLLDEAEQSRRTDVIASLSFAAKAAKLSDQTWLNDKRAPRALSDLKAGLPQAVESGPSTYPDSFGVGPVQPLARRGGFAILDEHGTVSFTSPLIKYERVAELEAESTASRLLTLEFAEGTDGVVMALFRRAPLPEMGSESRPMKALSDQGVVAYFPDGTRRIFTKESLVRPMGKVGASMTLSGVSGNEVVLIDASPRGEMTLASVEITDVHREPVRRQVPGVVKMPSPHFLQVGSHLVFFEYKNEMRPTPGIPAPNVSRLTAREFRNATASVSWPLDEQSFTQACSARTPQTADGKSQACEVTLINDLQQSGYIALALWQFSGAGRFGPYGRASVSHLVVLDPKAGGMMAIELGELAKRRQTCSKGLVPERGAKEVGKVELRDDVLPDFLVPSDHGVTLIFRSESTAQLIVVRDNNVGDCHELYLPAPPTLSWTSGPQGLLAAAPKAGYRWDLSAGPAETYVPPMPVCNGAFDRAAAALGRKVPAQRDLQIKDICG